MKIEIGGVFVLTRNTCPIVVQLIVIAWSIAAGSHAPAANLVGDFAELLVSPSLDRSLHRAYDRRDGLPSDWINDIVKTRDGFIWIATDNGLARFDGLRFRTFDSSNTPQLPHHEIRVLYEDQHQVLWIGTTHGLASYTSGKPGTFRQTLDVENTVVHEIHEDSTGRMWVGTQDATYIKDSGKLFRPLKDAPRNVRAVCQDRTGRVWLGANSGLYRQDATTFIRIDHPQIPKETAQASGLQESRVNILFEDAAGDLWVGTNRTLLRLHAGQFLDRPPELDPQQIYDLVQMPDGALVIAARYGVFRITAAGNFEQVSERVSAFCLYLDEDERLWVGHGDNRGFHCYWTDYSQPIWNAALVRCLWPAQDGSLWFGTSQGLHHLKNGQEVHIAFDDKLPDTTVQTIFPARDGQLWIGTRHGLIKYAGGQLTSNGFDETSGLHIGVGYEDAHGNIWLGLAVAGGWVIRDRQLVELSELKHGRIHWFYENLDGHLWIGHESGLYQAQAGKITKLESPALAELQQPRLLCHAIAPDGSLWIGTSNGLLCHRNGQFVAIPPRAGLRADNIERLAVDQQGNLWFGGRDGLFFLEGQQIEKFLTKQADSLLSGKIEGFERFPPLGAFSQGCIVQGEMLWIVAEHGLVRLPLADVLRQPAVPKFTVESVELNGLCVPFADGCEFTSGNQRLTIHLTAPYFDTSWPLLLRYQLEGQDREWIEAGDTRTAHYTSLRPGDYRFLLNAQVGYGAWPEATSAMHIRVKPRWWETMWFRILAPITLVLTSGGITWQYLTQTRARNLLLLGEIRKRLETEHDLQQAESSFRALTLSTRAIPWEAELKPFAFTFIGNQITDILGYPVSECVRDGFWKTIILPQDVARVFSSYQRALESGLDYQIDFRIYASDGRIVHLHDVVHVVNHTDQGCRIGGFMIDVSAKRAAEESANSALRQLARLDRIAGMGEIATSIAHEIKQPLCAIVSNAETALRLLSRDVAKSASAVTPSADASSGIIKETLEDIVSDGNRASQIIDQIRTRVSQSPQPVEPLDLNRIARQCAVFVDGELRRRGLALKLQLASSLPWVRGSHVELQQVVFNLLMNAIQACETSVTPAEIVLVTTSTADWVQLSVVDQGVGIDGLNSKQMFEPFFTTKPQGTGIGLSISRTIIESCGGNIWASRNVDRGATFHIKLPAVGEHPQ